MSDLILETAEKIREEFKKKEHAKNSGTFTITGPDVDFKAVLVQLTFSKEVDRLYITGRNGGDFAMWIVDITKGGHYELDIGPDVTHRVTLVSNKADARSGTFVVDTDDDFTFAKGNFTFLADDGSEYTGAFDIKPVKSSS
jgi:hypothetical protein